MYSLHNDAFVELTGYPEKNGKIVVQNLKHLRNIIPKEDKIEIRSDGGTEFNNAVVRNYCKEKNISILFRKQVRGYRLSLKGVSEL